MFERWKDIPGYEGLYQVSNKGRVRSLDRVETYENQYGPCERSRKGKILSPDCSRYGYKSIMLYRNSSSDRWLIHRLVMHVFVGPCPDGLQVNHKDGNQENNKVGNLEYVTPAENVAHRDSVIRSVNANAGEKSPHAKLTSVDVKRIRKLRSENGLTWQSLADMFGVTPATVRRACVGKSWSHVR